MNHLRVADVGDVPMQSRYDLAQCHADIEAAYRTVARTRAIPCRWGRSFDHGFDHEGPCRKVRADGHGPY
jgi:hypothetical protein